MKYVQIINRKTKHVAAAIPIFLPEGTGSAAATAPQYETEGWKIAVEDQLVDPDREADYSFKIIETKP